jgi:predicted DNA-binding transcriptional regulator AlpA
MWQEPTRSEIEAFLARPELHGSPPEPHIIKARPCRDPRLAYPEQEWPKGLVNSSVVPAKADKQPAKSNEVARRVKARDVGLVATLGVRDAASYCGLSVNTFLREVKAGTLPRPIPLASRRRLWSRATLDRALAGELSPKAPALTIAEAIDAYDV